MSRHFKTPKLIAALLTLPLLCASAAQAQKGARPAAPAPRREAAPARAPRPERERTVEETLASDSYAFYAEVRTLLRTIRSQEYLSDVEIFRGLGELPAWYDAFNDFLEQHEEVLEEATLTVSILPARTGLPSTLVTLRLPSVEGARKFEPELRSFLAREWKEFSASVYSQGAGKPPAPAPKKPAGSRRQTKHAARGKGSKAALPFVIRRAGNLFLLGDAPFTLRKLRGDGTAPMLSDSARFQGLRGRFASAPVFVFADIALAQRGFTLFREKIQREVQGELATIPTTPTTNTATANEDETTEIGTLVAPVPVQSEETEQPPPPPPYPAQSPQPHEAEAGDEAAHGPLGPPARQGAGASIGSTIFPGLFGLGALGDPAHWPEAVGASFSVENEAFVLRALVVNPPDTPTRIIPFLTFIASGPELAHDTATLLPADSEIVLSASLDLEKIFESFVKSLGHRMAVTSGGGAGEGGDDETSEAASAEAAVEAAEKLFGFRVRQDLLPSLGNEVAVSVPLKFFQSATRYNKPPQAAAGEAAPGPVLIVSLKNPELFRSIFPRLLAATGVVPLDAQPKVEKRAGFEINSTGGFAYAFVNSYLVLAEQDAHLRHVLDSHAAQQTLASDSRFRAATSWEAPEKLAQLYVSDALMKSMVSEIRKAAEQATEPGLRELATTLQQPPDGVTYAATEEQGSVMHELHVPHGLLRALSVMETFESRRGPATGNETSALIALTLLRDAQDEFKKGKGQGRYGTFEELQAASVFPKGELRNEFYRFEVLAAGDSYRVNATPKEYGKTARRSFFLDESGVIRAADRQGQPATAADPPVD